MITRNCIFANTILSYPTKLPTHSCHRFPWWIRAPKRCPERCGKDSMRPLWDQCSGRFAKIKIWVRYHWGPKCRYRESRWRYITSVGTVSRMLFIIFSVSWISKELLLRVRRYSSRLCQYVSFFSLQCLQVMTWSRANILTPSHAAGPTGKQLCRCGMCKNPGSLCGEA